MKKHLYLMGVFACMAFSHAPIMADTVVVMSASDYAKANNIATKTLESAMSKAAQGEMQRLFKMHDVEAKEGGMDSKLYMAVTQKAKDVLLEKGKKAKEDFEADPFNSGDLNDYIKQWIQDNQYKVFSEECNKAGYPYMLFIRQGSDFMPKNHNCFQTKEQCIKYADKMESDTDYRTGGELENMRNNYCLPFKYVQDHKGNLPF